MENIKTYLRILFKLPSATIILMVGMFLLIKKLRSNEINIADMDGTREKIKEFVLMFHPYDMHFNCIFWGTLLIILTK